MDLSNPPTDKPFREWQIIGLILIALVALGFGQAVKKRPNNFPQPLPIETILPVAIVNSPLATTTLSLNEAIFTVELAQSADEQIRGLSERQTLGENEGMLFVYATTTTPSFWMKEMNFPIDIIWLDQNKAVVEITPRLSPDTYPETFSPKIPVQYVLEVPAGTASKTNLKIGDLIHFSL